MPHPWISERANSFDASGIRRVFDLAAKLKVGKLDLKEEEKSSAGEMVVEEGDDELEDQEQEEEGDLQIHGGEQQIEEEGFPTEQEMID